MFQRAGYHGSSWRALVEAAGTPWGSSHHHFPGGKEQLGVAAIELGGASVAAQLVELFARHRSVPKAVRAWCQASAEALARSGFCEGCPIATIALEMAPESVSLTSACREAFEAWCSTIASRLVESGVKKKRAGELATITVASLEGALLVARVSRSSRPLLLAGDLLASLLESELP